jgi:hypothetical protein
MQFAEDGATRVTDATAIGVVKAVGRSEGTAEVMGEGAGKKVDMSWRWSEISMFEVLGKDKSSGSEERSTGFRENEIVRCRLRGWDIVCLIYEWRVFFF